MTQKMFTYLLEILKTEILINFNIILKGSPFYISNFAFIIPEKLFFRIVSQNEDHRGLVEAFLNVSQNNFKN